MSAILRRVLLVGCVLALSAHVAQAAEPAAKARTSFKQRFRNGTDRVVYHTANALERASLPLVAGGMVPNLWGVANMLVGAVGHDQFMQKVGTVATVAGMITTATGMFMSLGADKMKESKAYTRGMGLARMGNAKAFVHPAKR